MKNQTCNLEIITPCFCAGADQSKAEIRASSIRGQLRWWFRTLGGFSSLPLSAKQQEAEIFGSVAGDGKASKLVVRVSTANLQSLVKDGQELGHKNFSDPAYLTFPIQSRETRGVIQEPRARKGVILSGKFDLHIQWRGDAALWPDIQALITVFGNLGSLGFRGRRAMGALALTAPAPLSLALQHFKNHTQLKIYKLAGNINDSSDAISKLGGWLRSWRSHGRTQDHRQNRNDDTKPPRNVGFQYAKRDHDIGYNIQGIQNQPAYRAALGLPIIQRTGNNTNNWEYGQNQAKGRFASPVLLRPHKNGNTWSALVIFADAHQWPANKQVFLNGHPRSVSLDLYTAMKTITPLNRLTPFP